MRVGAFRLAGIFSVILLSAVLAASAAAAQTPRSLPNAGTERAAPSSAPKAARPGEASGKAAPVLSDEALERAIRQRFAKSAIASNGFSVSVAGGVATLRGTARVAQHKGVATRLARSAGARRVRNEIELSPAARETMQRLRQGKTGATKAPKAARGNALQPSRAQSLSSSGRTDPATGDSPRQKHDYARNQREKREEAATNPAGIASSKKAGEAPKRFAVQPPLPDEGSPGATRLRERLRRY
ncbi:MAG: BON domain-containing protein [Bryobacterales bacterium]|nr:BON domain-containing protein [Bryobacterales bacterium]